MKKIVTIHYTISKEEIKSIKKQIRDKGENTATLAKKMGVTRSYLWQAIAGHKRLTERIVNFLRDEGIKLEVENDDD